VCRESEEEVKKPRPTTENVLGRWKAGDARSGRHALLMGVCHKE